MRHIRNFFHNISDIMLAIIVVAIACGVIYWRMQIIMEYPRKYVQAQSMEAIDSGSGSEEHAEAGDEAAVSAESDSTDASEPEEAAQTGE